MIRLALPAIFSFLDAMNEPTSVSDFLRQHIRTVPDWPAPGVQFRDITPLLQDPAVFRVLIQAFVQRYSEAGRRPDVVAGLDARGFILGAVVAYELNVGFVPIRKKGKLPFTTVAETYELEYGSATVELHTDAVQPGQRVLLIDDLIATGGTMMAGRKLLEKLGASVIEGAAIVNLPELGACWTAVLRSSPWWTLLATDRPESQTRLPGSCACHGTKAVRPTALRTACCSSPRCARVARTAEAKRCRETGFHWELPGAAGRNVLLCQIARKRLACALQLHWPAPA